MRLVNNEYGVAGWNGYYDEFGNLVISNMFDQDRKSVDPDSWNPLSVERFKGQIWSISPDETDGTDVADVADVTDVAGMTDEAYLKYKIYKLLDELELEDAV